MQSTKAQLKFPVIKKCERPEVNTKATRKEYKPEI